MEEDGIELPQQLREKRRKTHHEACCFWRLSVLVSLSVFVSVSLFVFMYRCDFEIPYDIWAIGLVVHFRRRVSVRKVTLAAQSGEG